MLMEDLKHRVALYFKPDELIAFLELDTLDLVDYIEELLDDRQDELIEEMGHGDELD